MKTTNVLRPQFITFTGVDDETDPRGLVELASDYPIEWGLLFSPSRQGVEPRYPRLQTIKRLAAELPLRWSAHLCGGAARGALVSGDCGHNELLGEYFERAQINTVSHVRTADVKAWADTLCIDAVVQCRASFPDDQNVAWLFDKSGGRGVEQTIWPQPSSNALCGYAGGLRPENVAQAVNVMVAGAGHGVRFWIDMESGVRDERDRFSLDKCRAVCEAVFGAPVLKQEAA